MTPISKTRKIALAIALVATLIVAIGFFMWQAGQPKPLQIDPDNARLTARGRQLYAANCASCHGSKLEGQPDWRTRLPNGRLPAPPHDQTGHTWHHPDQILFSIVKDGLVPGVTAPPDYQSDMPAFKNTFTDADIIAVLAYIKSTWPADVQQAQEEVSAQQRSRGPL